MQYLQRKIKVSCLYHTGYSVHGTVSYVSFPVENHKFCTGNYTIIAGVLVGA